MQKHVLTSTCPALACKLLSTTGALKRPALVRRNWVFLEDLLEMARKTFWKSEVQTKNLDA